MGSFRLRIEEKGGYGKEELVRRLEGKDRSRNDLVLLFVKEDKKQRTPFRDLFEILDL
jgi:hypothetical protein